MATAAKRPYRSPLRAVTVLACGVGMVGAIMSMPSTAQQDDHPAFVVVERVATTGPKSIQQEYAKLAREILNKYGGRYLARSQSNRLLEGDGTVPCCMAILQFPNMDAVMRWYSCRRTGKRPRCARAVPSSA